TGAMVMRKRVGRSKVLEFFGHFIPPLYSAHLVRQFGRRLLARISNGQQTGWLVAVPGRDRSLPISALLEPRAAGGRSYGEADAAELCEGLSQARQERRQRCGGDL